jgi:hypothetical protein
MKAKVFLIVICLFCAGVLSAQNSPFIRKWEQQARTRGASWNSFTRAATAANRPRYTSLYLKGKFLASFNDNSTCHRKIDELVGIAENTYGKPASTTTSKSRTKGQATRDLERITGVNIDAAMGGLDNTLSRKKAEADAKRKKEVFSEIRGYCECRSENNPNYKSGTQSAKPNDFDNSDLFAGGNNGSTDNTPDNPLLDGIQTQYDNPFDAPSARDPLLVQQGALPSVSLNFDDAEKYAAGTGIRVGNPNWVSDWQTPPELEELDYMTGKFDVIKKEITVDLKFRDEVADSIRSFLENGTASIPQLMGNLYKERTGYDIEELRNKQYLTEEERKIVEDYNRFVKQMAIELDYQANEAKKKPDPEKNLIDFAIMAGDVYKDGSRLLKDTDWRPLTSSGGIEDEAIARAIDAINSFNTQNNNNSGFYAQIYKNELTGEYTLAFRGSEMTATDWKNNIQQGFSFFSEQYAFAASIGECLSRSNAKINIVGHSLGGGLATVAGLKTSFPTYTYNQADISQGTVDKYKLDVSKSDNITAHYVEGEILTTLQSETREYNTLIPLGKKVKTGSIIATEESAILTAVSKTGNAVGGVVPYAEFAGTVATVLDKGDNLLVMGDGHRMPSIEQYFRSTYSKSQVKWEGYNNVRMVLKNDKTYSNLLIDTK